MKISSLISWLLASSTSRFLAVTITVITLILGIFLPRLTFNFEFENLFPSKHTGLQFFQDNIKEFGFDNDYISIMVLPESTIYDTAFVQSVQAVSDSLKTLDHIGFVYSAFDLKKLIKSPLGPTGFPLFNRPERVAQDSAYVANDPYLSRIIHQHKLLTILIKHDHMDGPAVQTLVDGIQGVMQQSGLDHRIIGKVPAKREFVRLIKIDFSIFLGLSLIFCSLTLWFISKKIQQTFLPLLISAITLVWTFGLMALLDIQIDILTSLLPPIVLFVASSDTIHLISSMKNSKDRAAAFHKVFVPTLLTSTTTAAGFFSLTFIGIEPLKLLGIFAGIGTLLAFAITYALAPSFLRKSSEELPVNTFDFTPFVKWVDRQKRGIVIGFALIVGLGIWGVSKVKIDAYLLNDFPENSEVRASFRLADEIIGGTKPWQISIWVKDSTQSVWDVDVQREVDKVTDYLENDYPVASILSTSLILQYANYVEKGSFEIPEKNRRKTLILAQQIANQTKIKLVSNDKRKVRITGNIPEFGSYTLASAIRNCFVTLRKTLITT